MRRWKGRLHVARMGARAFEGNVLPDVYGMMY